MLNRIGARIAYELVTPRILPTPLVWIGRGVACLVIAWGFAVCVLTISAVLIAIIETAIPSLR